MTRKSVAGIALAVLAVAVAFAADPDFTVTAPKGWTKKASAALAQFQNGTGTLVVTADALPENANSPDTYVEFAKAQFAKTFTDCAFEPVVSGKKDGFDTRELKFTAKMSGFTVVYDILYVFNKGKAYTLTAGNMKGMYEDSYPAEVSDFFASFKFK